MIRRRYGSSLHRATVVEEDVNPNASITNIADCMLVLVLGLFVALVAHYGVNLQEPEPADEPGKDMVGIEINMDENNDGEIDDNYTESGSVYYDKETGNFYYVADED